MELTIFEEPTSNQHRLEELKSLLQNNEIPLILVEHPQMQTKTDVIKNCVQEFKDRSCWFDCTEPLTFNKMFGTILNKLLKPELDLDEVQISNAVLDNMNIGNIQNFIYKIPNLKKIKYKNQIVFLENAEYLAKSNKYFIELLSKINDLIQGLKFTTVLISSHKLDHYNRMNLLKEIYRIELCPYQDEQIQPLILFNKPTEFAGKSYSNFVNTLVSGQANLCRDPITLKYVCEKYYEKYQTEQTLNETNGKKNEILTQIKFVSQKNNNEIQSNLIYRITNKFDQSSELTYCGKYLLIAAYLASYNSPTTDKRFFSKDQGEKLRKPSKNTRLAFSKDKKLFGPGKFTFERLFQIYKALQDFTEDKEIVSIDQMKTKSPTNYIFQQFQTFLSLKLILVVDKSSEHCPYSSSAKYSVSDFITNEFIKNIAESIEIELDAFLERNILK